MKRTRLLSILLAAALAGCAAEPKPERVLGELAPGSFEIAWAADAGVDAPAALYQDGDYLFVYGKDRTVGVFDLTGALKFKATIGEPGDLPGEPAVGPGRIVFPVSASLDIFTPDGIKTKTQRVPLPLRSPAVVANDEMYFGSDSETGGRVAALSLTRQYNVFRWTRLTGIVSQKPALFDSTLYAGTNDGRVYAITLDGNPLWAKGPEMPDNYFQVDGRIIAAVKADDSGVYVPATDTKLYCLAPNSGRVRWVYFAGTRLVTTPVLTADTVYQYVDGVGVVALPKKSADRNATPAWTYAPGKTAVADDSRYAYLQTTGNALVAVNKADGTEAFRTTRSDFKNVVQSPDPKNPAVYALTAGGQLVCVKPVLRAGRVGELAMLTPQP